jgi:hypothetical protein
MVYELPSLPVTEREVSLLAVTVRLDAAPELTLVGLAEMVTVGGVLLPVVVLEHPLNASARMMRAERNAGSKESGRMDRLRMRAMDVNLLSAA